MHAWNIAPKHDVLTADAAPVVCRLTAKMIAGSNEGSDTELTPEYRSTMYYLLQYGALGVLTTIGTRATV